jgi:hypothetical protein
VDAHITIGKIFDMDIEKIIRSVKFDKCGRLEMPIPYFCNYRSNPYLECQTRCKIGHVNYHPRVQNMPANTNLRFHFQPNIGMNNTNNVNEVVSGMDHGYYSGIALVFDMTIHEVVYIWDIGVAALRLSRSDALKFLDERNVERRRQLCYSSGLRELTATAVRRLTWYLSESYEPGTQDHSFYDDIICLMDQLVADATH